MLLAFWPTPKFFGPSQIFGLATPLQPLATFKYLNPQIYMCHVNDAGSWASEESGRGARPRTVARKLSIGGLCDCEGRGFTFVQEAFDNKN